MSISPDRPILIKGVKAQYMNTKTDIYKSEISYFKINGKDIEGKLSKLNLEGFKLPWFKTDDGKYIIKVKSKNVKVTSLEKLDMYVVNISLKYYEMDDKEGYYINSLSA